MRKFFIILHDGFVVALSENPDSRKDLRLASPRITDESLHLFGPNEARAKCLGIEKIPSNFPHNLRRGPNHISLDLRGRLQCRRFDRDRPR